MKHTKQFIPKQQRKKLNLQLVPSLGLPSSTVNFMWVSPPNASFTMQMIRHYGFQQLAGCGNCGNCFRNLISLTTPDMCAIFQHHLLSVFELTCGRFGFVRCRREKDGAPQVGGKSEANPKPNSGWWWSACFWWCLVLFFICMEVDDAPKWIVLDTCSWSFIVVWTDGYIMVLKLMVSMDEASMCFVLL